MMTKSFLRVVFIALLAGFVFFSTDAIAGTGSDGQGNTVVTGSQSSERLHVANCKVPLSAKLNETRRCFLCPLFKVLFTASTSVSVASFEHLAEPFQMILVIGFALYIAYLTLKQVSAFTKQDGSKYISELLIMGFKVLVAYLLLANGQQVYKYGLEPILSTGMEIGSSFLSSSSSDKVSNIASCKSSPLSGQNRTFYSDAFEQRIDCFLQKLAEETAVSHVIGSSIYCVAKFPHIGAMISGLLIMGFSLLVSIAFGFYLIDSIIRLGILGAILPFLIAAWPFKKTAQYTSKGWSMFLNAFFIFVFLGLIMAIVVEIIASAITKGDGNAEEIMGYIASDNVAALQKYMAMGGAGFLFLIICGLFAFKLCKEAASLASEMGTSGGTPIGSQIGGLAYNTTKRAAGGALKLSGGGVKLAAHYLPGGGGESLASRVNIVKNNIGSRLNNFQKRITRGFTPDGRLGGNVNGDDPVLPDDLIDPIDPNLGGGGGGGGSGSGGNGENNSGNSENGGGNGENGSLNSDNGGGNSDNGGRNSDNGSGGNGSGSGSGGSGGESGNNGNNTESMDDNAPPTGSDESSNNSSDGGTNNQNLDNGSKGGDSGSSASGQGTGSASDTEIQKAEEATTNRSTGGENKSSGGKSELEDEAIKVAERIANNYKSQAPDASSAANSDKPTQIAEIKEGKTFTQNGKLQSETIKDSEGNLVKTSYDKYGNISSILSQDANGNREWQKFDESGQVIESGSQQMATENGRTYVKQESVKTGKSEVVKTFHSNGKISSNSEYGVHGSFHQRSYDDKGKIQSERSFYADINKAYTTTYKDGKPVLGEGRDFSLNTIKTSTYKKKLTKMGGGIVSTSYESVPADERAMTASERTKAYNDILATQKQHNIAQQAAPTGGQEQSGTQPVTENKGQPAQNQSTSSPNTTTNNRSDAKPQRSVNKPFDRLQVGVVKDENDNVLSKTVRGDDGTLARVLYNAGNAYEITAEDEKGNRKWRCLDENQNATAYGTRTVNEDGSLTYKVYDSNQKIMSETVEKTDGSSTQTMYKDGEAFVQINRDADGKVSYAPVNNNELKPEASSNLETNKPATFKDVLKDELLKDLKDGKKSNDQQKDEDAERNKLKVKELENLVNDLMRVAGAMQNNGDSAVSLASVSVELMKQELRSRGVKID